ncbi:MAG TPA: hypothetical protein VK898_09145 [Chloroflexota bacterium]|nr:hypothetical protein [Chloroflexota bacterium]
MLKALVCRALPLTFLALSTSHALAFAEDPAAETDPMAVSEATDDLAASLTADNTAIANAATDTTASNVATDSTTASSVTDGPRASAATDASGTSSSPVDVSRINNSASTVLSTAALSDQAAALPSDTEHWTAYGFNVTAPSSMWPMLELLHQQKFDWELYSAGQRPTPVVWAALPPGVYGSYMPSQNVVKLSFVLQSSSVEVATAFLAHEFTHLNDDLNGRLGNMTGDVCYQAETRAFVNEANFWQMVVGPKGKTTQDSIEAQENAKMHAFVGNSQFADLVLRTTASYIKQCGS